MQWTPELRDHARTVLLAACCALLAWLALMYPFGTTSEAAMSPRLRLRGAPSPEVSLTPTVEPASPSTPRHTRAARACLQRVVEDPLVREMKADCASYFARAGLCPAPVPFLDAAEAAAGHEALAEMLGECALAASSWIVDCSEYPCIAAIRRAAMDHAEGPCAPKRADLPTADDVATLGLDWQGWVPLVIDMPDHPRESAWVKTRLSSRLQRLGPDLDSEVAGTREATTGDAVMCAAVDRDLEAFHAHPSCDSLRHVMRCSEDDVGRVDDAGYEALVERGERIAAELRRDCDALAGLPTVLDCTSMPCIFGVRLPEAEFATVQDTFCAHPEIRSWAGGGRMDPDVQIAVLKHPDEVFGHLYDRWWREKTGRILDVIEALEARSEHEGG